MKKSLGLLLASITLFGVFATGCQQSTPKETTATAAKETAAAGDASADETDAEETAAESTVAMEERSNIDLTFLDFVPSPQREDYFTKMMDGYTSERPYISMEYGSVPYEEAVAKLTTLAAAQDLPDVVNFHSSVKWQFAPSGWLVPLDKYIDAESGYKDSFVEAVARFQWDEETNGLGAIYAMPDGIMTNGIFIRKDWVEEAGLDLQELRADWTWETYIDTVYKLTDVENGRYGISYRGGSAAFDRIQQYLVANTGGYDFDAEGNCLWYTPENVERVQTFIDMYLDGCAPKDSVNWGFAEMVDNFTGGLTATLNNDVEVVATCLERLEDDQWTVMPLPKSSIDGNIPTYAGSAYNYGISAFSDNPDDAWGFIEFISRPDNNVEYCKLLTMMPIRKNVDDPFFGEDGPVYGFMTQLQDPGFTQQPAYGQYLDVATFRENAHVEWQKVLMGERTVDEVLKEYDEEITEIAKKWLADNPDKELGKLLTFGGEIPYTGPSGENE